MAIKIIAVGKLKAAYWSAAFKEYQQRLSKYCKFSIEEVADEKDPGTQSPISLEKVKETEGRKILSRIKPQDVVVALCIQGESMPSEAFSDKIKQWHDASIPLVFVIGGSLGLSDEVLLRANMKFSFSQMTFPHQLARIILIEQLYRSFKIISGERYHK